MVKKQSNQNAFDIKMTKCEIFIHWLDFRMNGDNYEIDQIIKHGVIMVKLGKQLKILKRQS